LSSKCRSSGATADDVLTASAAATAYLGSQERLSAARTLVVGSQARHDELAKAGVQLVGTDDAETADIVIVGGHDHFDYSELRAAVRAIRSGASLFATGRDRFVPTRNGRDPATGAILAAIETAYGSTATITGKPAHIFTIPRHLLPGCKRVTMIGDNLATEIARRQARRPRRDPRSHRRHRPR
jgi:ribonucleotide monophosphatase NagD (HAD superfamily)